MIIMVILKAWLPNDWRDGDIHTAKIIVKNQLFVSIVYIDTVKNTVRHLALGDSQMLKSSGCLGAKLSPHRIFIKLSIWMKDD